jgi:hypothetical protein
VKVGVGGRVGPFRGGISTRGFGAGIGPFSAGGRWTRGGGGGGGGGEAFAVLFLLATLVLAVVAAAVVVVAGPYMLGTWLAVQFGAGRASTLRVVVGSTMEAVYVTVVVCWLVRRYRTRRAERKLDTAPGRLSFFSARHGWLGYLVASLWTLPALYFPGGVGVWLSFLWLAITTRRRNWMHWAIGWAVWAGALVTFAILTKDGLPTRSGNEMVRTVAAAVMWAAGVIQIQIVNFRMIRTGHLSNVG